MLAQANLDTTLVQSLRIFTDMAMNGFMHGTRGTASHRTASQPNSKSNWSQAQQQTHWAQAQMEAHWAPAPQYMQTQAMNTWATLDRQQQNKGYGKGHGTSIPSMSTSQCATPRQISNKEPQGKGYGKGHDTPRSTSQCATPRQISNKEPRDTTPENTYVLSGDQSKTLVKLAKLIGAENMANKIEEWLDRKQGSVPFTKVYDEVLALLAEYPEQDSIL